MRLLKYALGAIGILALSMAISVTGFGQVAASALEKGIQKVQVTGGTVKVSGGVNVNNTPNVNVGNTPNVNISNSPTVRLDPNANSVQSAPSAPTQPVQFSANDDLKAGTTKEDDLVAYTVPPGKRLVIEFVSAHYSQQLTSNFAHAAFSIGTGPLFYVSLVNELGAGRGSGYDFEFVGSELTRVYADAGQQVIMHVPHDPVVLTPSSVDMSFSGYLVSTG